MQHFRILLSIVLCSCCHFVYCQRITKGLVLEKETGEPVAGAVITFADGASRQLATITNAMGQFVLNNATGKKIRISYIGFQTLTATADSNAVYRLLPDVRSLNEVEVTAQESRGLSTASTIKRHAMEHLQPSSFADLLELLPGGRASNSSLATPNTISLREVPIAGKDYNTSSLGTQFVVDGAPVSSNANMQRVAGALDRTAQQRDFTNTGIDMRTISTDDIQDVEIVRGIPPVKYGDLTSGLVKINRRKGGNDLAARFKADMSTKLFYVGKAFEHAPSGMSLNLSADYLNSKADPRNVLETYQRITFSARLNKRWKAQKYDLQTGLNLDYGGSFDDEKVDPELNHGGVDKYVSKYNRYALAFHADVANKQKSQWFKNAELSASFSFERNRTERTRLVQLDGDTPAATTQQTGESDAVFIYPYSYTATHTVDGRPLSLFVRGEAAFSLPLRGMSNTLLAGSDFLLDKNQGEGQIFDRLRPLYPETFSRPRRFADVPASHELSLYAQERITIPLRRHRIELEAGLRAETMPWLAASYALNGKFYLDPRINIGWTLPTLLVGGKPFTVSVTLGAGKHTKFPTIDQLYPEPQYIDFVEFSYFHAQREYRRMRLQTYVVDAVNPQLAAARNTKWELRGDISFAGNRLTMIYFEEDMRSGFRSMNIFSPYIYKAYTTNGVPPSQLTTPPNIDTLPYSQRSRLRSHQVTSNGSRTFKRGIEYTFASTRLPLFNTRVTVNGAWFKTSYHNSTPVMEKPSRIVNGRTLEAAGIYQDDEGYIREMFNTNFTFDSDIPQLKLGISLSAQCLWFTAQQSMLKEAVPQQYMDADGTIRPYTQTERQDMALRYLVRQISASAFERQTVPFSMNINLKATKKLWQNKLMIALFVNKLWDAHPDYERNQFIVRRYVTPYFGLETSIRL